MVYFFSRIQSIKTIITITNYFSIKQLILTGICGSLLLLSSYQFPETNISYNKDADVLFAEQLGVLKAELTALKTKIVNKYSQNELQQQFRTTRLAYKKVAVFLDYFNQQETMFLNAPALPRTESEIADKIIEPSGLQVLEELLFSADSINYARLFSQTEQLLSVMQQLEQEPNRAYKFTQERLFHAIRLSMVRLMALGITGFDSPIALHSLPEAIATIEGTEAILVLYQSSIETKDKELWNQLTKTAASCKSYLKKASSFTTFNRLVFISEHLNPYSRLLWKTTQTLGYYKIEGSRPLHANAATVFDTNSFNIHFFSPPDPYTLTTEKIELGRQLFYDPVLSGNNNRSCASCHQPQKAFTDGLPTAQGLNNNEQLIRNTPTLWNSGLQTRQFWDSRADILENQLDEVIHNEKEMKGSLKESVARLQDHEIYSQLFKKAYPHEQQPITSFTIANAVCSYIRSLTALNSRFDQSMRGNQNALTTTEQKGFNLFTGKAKCATCHFIPLFNGMVPPVFGETESEVLGVPATNSKTNILLDADLGKAGFTRATIHNYSFKTPTLRNVALTAPYMHNGVFNTLEEVLNFYNQGGGYGLGIAPGNQTLPRESLHLTKKEIKQVIAFMKTLTDTVYRPQLLLQKK
jgi:cytochrome c peroxidase